MSIAPAELARKSLGTDEGIRWIVGMDIRFSDAVPIGEIYKTPVHEMGGLFGTKRIFDHTALLMHPLTYASIVGAFDWEHAIDIRVSYHRRQLEKLHNAKWLAVVDTWAKGRNCIYRVELRLAQYEAVWGSPVTWGDPGE